MEFEEIGKVWRQESTLGLRRTRTEDLSSALDRAARYSSGVRRRFDLTARIVGIPLVGVFLYMAIRAPNAFAAVGAIVLAIWAVVVVVWYRSISRTPTDLSQPVRQAVQAEVSCLRVLERFGRRAVWGRVFLAIGTLLYAFGSVTESASVEVQVAWMGAFVLLFAFIELLVRIQRRRRPSHIRALREDLESWLRGLDEFEAGDQNR